MLPIPLVGEDEDHIARIPRAMVVNIIRPRLEETFELVRDRLEQAGIAREAGTRVVLTGGGSQLIGVRELAARVLDRQVRLGRPRSVRGLPETAGGPPFAVATGLLAWAAGEGRPIVDVAPGPERPQGVMRRFFEWLRMRA
jgi:cell division protein FtsA